MLLEQRGKDRETKNKDGEPMELACNTLKPWMVINYDNSSSNSLSGNNGRKVILDTCII